MALSSLQLFLIAGCFLMSSEGKLFTKPAACPVDYVIYDPEEMISEQEVESEPQCLLKCDLEADCQSYNYEVVEETADGICELSREAADRWGLDLVTQPGFEHHVKVEEGASDPDRCTEYPGPQHDIEQVEGHQFWFSRGDQSGFWMKDIYDEQPERFWESSGYNSINWIDEFENEAKYRANSRTKRHTLSDGNWDGVNNAVIRGRFWYRIDSRPHIHVMDLETDTLVGRLYDLQAIDTYYAGHNTGCQWDGGRESATDLAVDESGLWVIWGRSNDNCYLSISKIDDINIRVTKTWHTNVHKTSVGGNSFMAQGILYIVNHYNSRPAWIKYAFNTRNNSMTDFESDYLSHISISNNWQYQHYLDYNPVDRMLYSIENTHHVRYPVTFRDLPNPSY